MITSAQERNQSALWPDNVFQEVLKQLKKPGGRILNGPKLPLSVWHEVQRRTNELDVMTILFSELAGATTSLIQPSKPSDRSVQHWAQLFCDDNSPWAAWIRQHGEAYGSIEAAEDSLGGHFNTGWALRTHTPNKYGHNISQRRLFTWLNTNQISVTSAAELLKMIRSTWWRVEDLECSSLGNLRRDLDAAANSMVKKTDMSVPADGKNHVWFYWRDPVEVLQLVSANSMCRTSHACTFDHPSTQLPSYRRAALPPSPLPLQHEC